ncbi:MAG: hypothetical protein WBP13_06900 [Methylophilaceae bacterium]
MAFDRMDWHYGGDYPTGLPTVNGGTHIGMFLAWVIEHQLVGDMHLKDSKVALKKLLAREITGRDFLVSECDEKFWDEDLNAQGLAFTKDYYVGDTAFADQHNDYLKDYCDLFNAHAEANGFKYESTYHIENTWDNYDKLKPIIDQRFAQWQVWTSNPANLTLDPHTQFLNACAAIAEKWIPLGFKAIKNGTVLKKTSADKDLTFSIVLNEERYNSRKDVKMYVTCTIHSKKTKKWMFEQTQSKYGEGLVYYLYLKQFVKQKNPEWNVAGSSFETSVMQISQVIEQQYVPIIEIFEQPAKAAAFLAKQGTLFTEFSESEIQPLAYLICLGFKAEAEQFLNNYITALPSQWRSNLRKVYISLPGIKDINLMVSECTGAMGIKLAYVHGLTVNLCKL